MAKTTKVDKETLRKIRNTLRNNVAPVMNNAHLTPVGPTAFGGSTGAANLADDLERARHHVLASSHRTGQAVDHMAHALDDAVKYADESDDQSHADAAAIDNEVTVIQTKYDDPSYRKHPTQSTHHGRTS